MARYRSKDDVDLAWNAVRRRITMEVRVQVKEYEERLLNELLTAAWEEFKKGLAKGELLELEARYDLFVKDVIGDVVDVKLHEAA